MSTSNEAASPLANFKAKRAANLAAQYERDKASAVRLKAEVDKLMELEEFDAASMKARSLADLLSYLNATTNRLADIDG